MHGGSSVRYYHPGNASIGVAGDIDPDEALALVARVFRGPPAGSARRRRWPAVAALAGGARLLLEDRVELPRLYHRVAHAGHVHAGDAELDLAADMLANGKTSRLYRRLVYDERVATDVSASQNSREIAGFLQSPPPRHPAAPWRSSKTAIVEEVARLGTDGPSDDEIDRGRIQAEAQFMFRLQTVGGFGGKSDQLNAYNMFLGDPAFFDRDLARYQAVTSVSVRDAVGGYLAQRRRVALSIVPRGRADLALPESTPAVVS